MEADKDQFFFDPSYKGGFEELTEVKSKFEWKKEILELNKVEYGHERIETCMVGHTHRRHSS